MPGAVLLTGSTGFVGMELLARYLERTDLPIYALVRARDEPAADERLREVLSLLYETGEAFADRVTAVPADLESPGLGLSARYRRELPEQVGQIVHAAASVSFELPLEPSRRINVEGTRRMLDFAERCPVESFAYISTAYVAGTHTGEFREDQLAAGQGFRNPYEHSKFEAERLVRERAGALPVQIFRPSVIVGESSTGWTDSFNVLYAPLQAYANGHLPVVPARPQAPVDVVPVDYVADAVFELARPPVERPDTYHLVAGRESTTVAELISLAADHLGRRRSLMIPPALYRRLLHPLLVWRSEGRRERALRRMEAFFPYFASSVRYRNERARRRLEPRGIRVAPIRSYFGRLVDFAMRARWGRRKLGRAEALERGRASPAGYLSG